MTNSLILEKAAKSFTTGSQVPSAPEVVAALLATEKAAKSNKVSYSFEQLIGNWRLCFITGTKKTRQKAGIIMGAGRYIPQFVKIKISYQKASAPIQEKYPHAGSVENCVQLGGLQLILSGATKFLPNKNILAFDFTTMTVKLFGVTLYRGSIRGGKSQEEKFYTENVSKQAFFSYFFVTEKALAARGREGGLALWCRD